jgi:hypothetical protein
MARMLRKRLRARRHSINMKKLQEAGQTLIALLVFMLVAMTVTLAATAIAIINIKSDNSLASGQTALLNANSGIENAIVSLERNPAYTGGTITLASGTATISISGTTTVTIVSVGTVGRYQRTETATLAYANNIYSLTSWIETP